MDRIIEVCKELNVDAVHPGYGFLSENSTFAKMVTDNGITFIGPSPEAIEVMGDKLAAKNAVSAYNVPMVPGVNHAVSQIDEATKIANEIGYPVLIKASAGGGGKGMRVVEKKKTLTNKWSVPSVKRNLLLVIHLYLLKSSLLSHVT